MCGLSDLLPSEDLTKPPLSCLAGGSRETLLVYDAAKVPQWSLPITATTDFR